MNQLELTQKFPNGTTVGFAIALFINHAFNALHFSHPPIWTRHLLAWGMDCLLLTLVMHGIHYFVTRPWLFQGIRRILPALILYPTAGALALYPFLLPEYLAHPVNVFEAGPGTIRFTILQVIGPTGFLWAAFTWLTGAIIGRRRGRFSRFRRPMVILLVIVALTMPAAELGVPFLVPYPHPLAFSLLSTLRHTLFSWTHVVPSPERTDIHQANPVPLSFPPAGTAGRYDHIILLVMESMTRQNFRMNYLEPADGFLTTLQEKSAWFANHHTTNLDSYTSLLAMLTGRQVPYRAYENPEYFEALNHAPSLVQDFAARGFHTGFFCTAQNQPFVPCRGQWTTITEGKDLSGEYRRLKLNPVEDAWEDRAVLPAILQTLRDHPQTFLMHEMVMGHTPRWEELTGIGTVHYYNLFFRELFSGVEDAGLTNRTLFVILGDHGDRLDASLSENYQVPLLFIGNGLNDHKEDAAIRSHLDLPGLLFAFQYGSPRPPARNGQLVIGHTGRWTYGFLQPDGSSIFLDALRGTVLNRHGDAQPKAAFAIFQQTIHDLAPWTGIGH